MPTNRLVVKEQVSTYASVLFDALNAEGGQKAILEARDQIAVIVASLRSNVKLEEVLKDSTLSPEQRADIARSVFGECNPALVSVLAIMAERGEIDLLPRVAESMEKLLSEKLNTVVVDVTTAVELDDHLREIIANKAASELGKQVVLNEHVDKSLLGGIIMSTSDERIDASLRTQVENARNVLRNNK